MHIIYLCITLNFYTKWGTFGEKEKLMDGFNIQTASPHNKIEFSYKVSVLNEEGISVENYEKLEAVTIKEYEIEIVKAAWLLGDNASDLDVYTTNSACIEESQKEVYDKFSSGHWISKSLYSKIDKVLSHYKLSDKINTFCIILLTYKSYKNVLSEPIPKRPELSDIQKFENLLSLLQGSHKGIKITISLPDKGTVAVLGEEFFQNCKEWYQSYKSSLVGKVMFAIQGCFRTKDDKFYSKLEYLNITNRTRTMDDLQKKLIKQLYYMLQNKIPTKRERLIFIGSLLATIGVFSETTFPNAYSSIDDYYYDIIRKYIS